MGASWFVARTQLRQRWVGAVVLTLIVGLTGAVVLASLAGARRTGSAYDRFRDETLEPDLTLFVPSVDDATIDRLRAVPGVEGLAVLRQFVALVDGSFSGGVGGPLNRDFARTIARARVLEGRLPRQDRVGEVAVPEPLVQARGLRIGDRFDLSAYTPEQIQEVLSGEVGEPGTPRGPKVPLRVVGIVRSPQDLSLQGETGGVVVTTRAFTRKYADEIGSFSGMVLVVRTSDADAARHFVKVARAETASRGEPGEFQVQPTSETTGGVRDSIDVVATGLAVFGVVAALAGLVVIAVVIRRFVDGGAGDIEALRGLGMSRGGQALALSLALVPVAVVGAAVAVVGASLASPLFPFGLARRAEPHLGVQVDPLVLGIGFLVSAALVAAAAWLSARLVIRAALRGSAPPTRGAAWSGAIGSSSSPSIRVGIAAATDRARGSAPALPAVTGVFLAVAGLIAVAVVAGSLRHLKATPASFGYNWDARVLVGNANRVDPGLDCSPSQVSVTHDRAVVAAADVCSEPIEVEGYSVSGLGFMPLRGNVGPTVLEGRAPRAPNEVALGTATLSRVHAAIGDSVRIVGSGGAQEQYRIVGRVALPAFSSNGGTGDIQAIADGATFTGDGLERIVDNGSDSQAHILVRWRDGTDVHAASARIEELPGRTHRPVGAAVPLEVDRFDQIRVLPWVLGIFLVLIGVLGVAFGLVTSVQRRARDIAILKTVGFRRGQVAASVAVQATVYGLLGLAIGIPVGALIGHATWSRIAGRAGFAVQSIVSLGVAAAVIVGVVLIVNVVAWFPGRRRSTPSGRGTEKRVIET